MAGKSNAGGSTTEGPAGAQITAATTGLVRGIGLGTAVNLNVLNMIGVGPFITLPLMVMALGQRAIFGWILGAILAMCDGMIWAELGTRFPDSGGSYRYLNGMFGAEKWGRLLSFLYIWQLTFSAPLSTASGAVGLSQYAAYLWPRLNDPWFHSNLHAHSGMLSGFHAHFTVALASIIAMASCALATFLIYAGIQTVGRISRVLSVGVLLTIAWVIVAGLTHMHGQPGISHSAASAHGLDGFGAGLLIAIYNYGGYYNVCFLGGEVKDPRRVIPRAIVISILLVAALYVFMNISVLQVIPVGEFLKATSIQTRTSVIAVFMQRLYGPWAGNAMAVLIVWTAFSSVFAVLLGYSRVPYAAALDRNYFQSFAILHKTKHFPKVSLLALGGISVLFCLFHLPDLIAALIVTRIVFQFVLQGIGLMAFRNRMGGVMPSFKMPLYPVPVLIALAGFLFVLFHRPDFLRDIQFAGLLLLTGSLIFLFRSRLRREWPFWRSR